MNNSLIFDTLSYAKKLKTAGFSEEQAEAQVEVLEKIIDKNLATKKDIFEIKNTELKLTIRLGGLIAFSTGVLAILMKIL